MRNHLGESGSIAGRRYRVRIATVFAGLADGGQGRRLYRWERGAHPKRVGCSSRELIRLARWCHVSFESPVRRELVAGMYPCTPFASGLIARKAKNEGSSTFRYSRFVPAYFVFQTQFKKEPSLRGPGNEAARGAGIFPLALWSAAELSFALRHGAMHPRASRLARQESKGESAFTVATRARLLALEKMPNPDAATVAACALAPKGHESSVFIAVQPRNSDTENDSASRSMSFTDERTRLNRVRAGLFRRSAGRFPPN